MNIRVDIDLEKDYMGKFFQIQMTYIGFQLFAYKSKYILVQISKSVAPKSAIFNNYSRYIIAMMKT